jgi:hypothetical protein
MLVWSNKNPAEILDYDLDWSPRLVADTILTSTWTLVATDGALTINSNSFVTNRTKVWVSAGTLNYNYILQNTVTTANGDTLVERVVLPVVIS